MSIEENTLIGHCHFDGALTPIYCVGEGRLLYRGSSRKDGHWLPAPPSIRNQRCDPPESCRAEFAVLYLGDNESTVEYELQRLSSVKTDAGEKVERTFQPHRQVTLAAHKVKRVIAFIEVESPHLSPEYPKIGGGEDEYAQWRLLAQAVYRKVQANSGPLAVPIVGITYLSKVRGCYGRVFAMFVDFRDMALERGHPTAFSSD